jgi:hypothetical protein
VHVVAVLAVLVYAPPSGGAQARAAQVGQAVGRALAADGSEAIDGAIDRALAVVAHGWVNENELRFFARARAAEDQGRRHLERVELEHADEALGRAERLYEAELARPGVAPLWSQVALLHGVALYELGRAVEARAAFRRAVALEPSATLTEATVRPELARAFLEATPARPPVRLTIESEPPSELSVDGRALGRSPVTVEVPGPTHVVVARATGRRPEAALVDVDGALAVRLELAADLRVAALESLRARPSAAGVAQLAAALGLDGALVVAAGVDAGELILVGQRVSAAGCTTPPATVSLRGDALFTAATALVERTRAGQRCPGEVEVLASPALTGRRSIAAERAPAAPTRKPRFYERPWLWAGLLVVTSAAVALAATLAPQGTSYRVNVDGNAFSR